MSTSTTTITTLAPRGHEITVKCHPSPTVQSSSTIFDDSFNSVITVDSVSAAEHHLRSYLALANPIYDLRLRIREAVLFDKPVKNLLRAAFRQKRRYSYDRESLILRVYARSRPIHDAVLRLVSEFVARAGEASFFAPDEKECIGVGNTGVMLTRSHFSSKSGKKKPQAWTKYPDAVILFDDPNSKKDLPSVVFEVGFSESYPDLLSDAQQWLHKSSGKIRVVVLVDIVEDTKTLQTLQMSKRAQSRIRRLLTQFGTASAKAREGVDHEGPDPESDQEQYDNIEAQIVVEDWVGPISASLEVWHTVDNKPKMRGERITILPEPSTPQNPLLHITDIIPEASRTCFKNFDESRVQELNMDRYRKLLAKGIRAQAFQRALGYIRPRDQGSDSDYEPSDSEAE